MTYRVTCPVCSQALDVNEPIDPDFPYPAISVEVPRHSPTDAALSAAGWKCAGGGYAADVLLYREDA